MTKVIDSMMVLSSKFWKTFSESNQFDLVLDSIRFYLVKRFQLAN